MRALFDHNMPPAIARALDALVVPQGHRAIPLKDKFPVDISDIDLYTALGSEGGWFVVSKDRKNAKRIPEREAILRSGVPAFYVPRSLEKQRVMEQAAHLILLWDKMVAQATLVDRGLFQLPVQKGGKLSSL